MRIPNRPRPRSSCTFLDRHLRAPLHLRHRLRVSQGRHRRRAPPAERTGLEPHRRSASSKKENTNVDVFVLIDGDKAQGLAIIASEPREFTIVNIVGNIDLEQLRDRRKETSACPDPEIDTGRGTGVQPKPPAPQPAPAKPVSQNFQRRMCRNHGWRTEDQEEDGQLFHGTSSRRASPDIHVHRSGDEPAVAR